MSRGAAIDPAGDDGAGSRDAGVGLVQVRRALLSVSDKSGVVDLARVLAAHGVEIVSTGGTAKALRDAGLAVVPIEGLTGFPEMLDGRVKTLHPKVHGGLLARRDDAAHEAAAREHGIPMIDLVCVNLYPFERTVAQADVGFPEAIEQIDIGGPSMIRSAAKNHDFVVVVTDPSQHERVLAALAAHDGATPLALRRELAAAAFARTAGYDAAIAAWMQRRAGPSAEIAPAPIADQFPPALLIAAQRVDELRYGENPHQRAAVYRDASDAGPSVVGAALRHGKPLSYNNLNDAAAALEAAQDLHAVFGGLPAAVVVKHTNPCGAASAASAREAFVGAYEGDPIAAYGGIVAFSCPVDAHAAEAMVEGDKFLEVVVAPSFEPGAVELLGQRWRNVRLLAVGALDLPTTTRLARPSRTLRSIPGGYLVQERDATIASPETWTHAAGPAPDKPMLASAAFAWTVVKHLKSNAVCIASGLQLVGAGAGQMDRVASCRIAVEKSLGRPGEPRTTTEGRHSGLRRQTSDQPALVAASDAFFPFADGPRILVDAGVKCIVHPGGSKRDEETLALCRERDVTCLLTGVRHFRH
ncbi:MAG: bifunctional phosphoribosylaminoimidazolecarboxamide formyltransferase/IMP cyclohydrolase [Phycisphaerales bacterium]